MHNCQGKCMLTSEIIIGKENEGNKQCSGTLLVSLSEGDEEKNENMQTCQ